MPTRHTRATHGPYVIQYGQQSKFYRAPTSASDLGEWLDSAVEATEYQVKADAQHAISTTRIDRYQRMQCRVVPLAAVSREKRTASFDFEGARA